MHFACEKNINGEGAGAGSCGLNVCSPPPISYVEFLIPNVMVVGYGSLMVIRARLGHEGKALVMYLMAL